MTTPHLSHPRYRPDIDGLRAVAILLVVVYHAFPKLAPGGFIGVDLFFVISGYLISSILFKNLDRGTFTFREFYARRIKRIFPAFLFVTLSVLIVGWVILFPDEFWRTGKDAFNACLFILNITLIHGGGYFDMKSATRPFLHLWSLGVEEQYYLIWPVILVLAWPRVQRLGVLIAVIIALSFLANLALLHHSRDMAFYFPVSRFWQLLTGSALAYVQLRRPGFHLPDWTSWCGSAAIVLSVILLDDDKLFPGFWALLPTLGAAALIGAGERPWLNKNILSAKTMRWIGLISYPLYLWHWPILAFFKIINNEINVLQTLSALLLAFALATITFYVVETPLRFPQTPWLKRRGTALLMFLWILLLIVSLGAYEEVIPAQMMLNPARQRIVAAIDDWDFPDRQLDRDTQAETMVLNPGQNSAALIAGDSHVAMLWPYLKHIIAISPQDYPTLRVAAYGGCSTFPFIQAPNAAPSCIGFYRNVMTEVHRPDVKIIVYNIYWKKFFGSLFNSKTDSNAASPVLDQWAVDLKALVDSGKRVYIVLPMPSGENFDPKQMLPRIGAPNPVTHVEASSLYQEAAPLYTLLRKLAGQTGARLIDPLDAMCRQGHCPTISPDGRPLYKDADHVRPFAAIQYGRFLQPALRK